MKKNFQKIVLLVAAFIVSGVFPAAGFAYVTSGVNYDYIVTEDENFNRIFREGRDLIDQEQWEKAAAKFSRIVCDCPEKKGVDAAFYWLAFCYKKQNKFKEMAEAIDRLSKSFPKSSWISDAQVLKMQTAGNFTFTTRSIQGFGVGKPAEALTLSSTGKLPTELEITGIITSQSPAVIKINSENELKLAAFQSLFVANPKKGLSVLEDVLKLDSADEVFRSQIVRTLSVPYNSVVYEYYINSPAVGFQNSKAPSVPPMPVISAKALSPVQANTKLEKEDLSRLKDILSVSYKKEPSEKVRREMILTLAGLVDENSLESFVQPYFDEKSKAVKTVLLRSLSNDRMNPTLAAAKFNKLLEISRAEKDNDLKLEIFLNLSSHRNRVKEGFLADYLSEIYNNEQIENKKLVVINALAGLRENAAEKKLIEIAKNEKSNIVRLQIVRSLSNSRNPEVLKFLEDLIR